MHNGPFALSECRLSFGGRSINLIFLRDRLQIQYLKPISGTVGIRDNIEGSNFKHSRKNYSYCIKIGRYNDIHGYVKFPIVSRNTKVHSLSSSVFISRYRIQQGSFDDFTIDNQSGIVTISRKLDFDRRNTYQIEIVASDSGKFCRFVFHIKISKVRIPIPYSHFFLKIKLVI